MLFPGSIFAVFGFLQYNLLIFNTEFNARGFNVAINVEVSVLSKISKYFILQRNNDQTVIDKSKVLWTLWDTNPIPDPSINLNDCPLVFQSHFMSC